MLGVPTFFILTLIYGAVLLINTFLVFQHASFRLHQMQFCIRPVLSTSELTASWVTLSNPVFRRAPRFQNPGCLPRPPPPRLCELRQVGTTSPETT